MGSLDQPVGAFAREFAEEVLGLDSRVRRTLPALFFRPGEIAKEYVEGRRARFVPPIRLYLLTSFVMFLVLSQAGVAVEDMTVTVDGTRIEADSTPRGAGATPTVPAPAPETAAGTEAADGASTDRDDFGTRISRGLARISADPDAFSRLFFNRMAQSMFFLVPAFALFLKAVDRKRPYLHHAIFAIYLHCFVFTVVSVSALPEVLGLSALTAPADVLLVLIPIHLVLAMKRFYEGGWIGTTVRAATVSIAYAVLGGFTMTALLLVSLLEM